MPDKRFTSSTIFRLAEDCVDALEIMHGSNLLHRDVKPANFAMDCTDKDVKNVYSLDFDMVRQYSTADGILKPLWHKIGFRGTYKE